ncbi:MAG: ABC transporter ATP-binding protein [Bacteroidota bacterium]|nr:ABC transporter ATP-binding protein [Bacteroidota bacterium]
MTCLLGPNGVGKSTLIRTLSAVQKPLSGAVHIKEKNILDYKPDELARMISLVLTEKIPGGNLNVFELVSLGRYPYTGWSGNLDKEDKEKVIHSIKVTSIEHLKEKRIQELSDGELQKAMIARAIAQDGQIMFLDEPTAHLDVSNRVEIMTLLRKLAWETNKAILVSTHDLDLAIQTADKFWLCRSQSSFHVGTPEDLILNGKLAQTFEKEGFLFDKYSGNFKIKSRYENKIKIEGSGLHHHWLSHALNRIRNRINTDDVLIEIKEENGNVIYHLISKLDNAVFNNIEALMVHLMQNKF